MVRINYQGFALPSIMIASVVMLILLASAIGSVATSRTALDEQYYNALGREAAESGVRMAEACMRNNNMVISWTNAKPLRPHTDCNGDVVTGRSPYVLEDSNFRTSFRVSVESSPSGVDVMPTQGSVERLRTSNGTVWWSTNQSLKAEISGEMLSAQYIQSGFAVVCGIFDSQTWCWGGNADGKLGLGYASEEIELTPRRMLRDPGLLYGRIDKMVSVSNYTTCVVTTDNEIFCVGRGNYGQLGNGTTNDVTRPVQLSKPVGMTGEITHITARDQGFCAISGGDVWCWGRGNYGGNGNNSTAQQNVPVKAHNIGTTNSPSRPAIDVASDSESTQVCALVQVSGAGRPYCWGVDSTGALGDNTPYTQSNVPVAVTVSGVLSGKNLTKIVVSGRYPGIQVGDQANPSEAQIVSCAAAQGTDVAKRKCQRTGQACVLDTAGKIYCWGANNYGQLGTGTGHASYGGVNPHWRSPAPVAADAGGIGTKTFDDIAAAITATCGLVKSENLMYCWGLNERGVLGRGSGTPNNVIYATPAPVAMQTPGLAGHTIDYITGGANRFCAVTTDQRAYCWGVGDSYGQIGDGARQNRNVPTEATMLRLFRPALVY